MKMAPKLRIFIATLAAWLVSEAAAQATDLLEATVGVGYVSDGDAKVRGQAGDYRFRGATSMATIFVPSTAKPNQWWGVYGEESYLVNAYTKNDAAERMIVRDLGGVWQFATPSLAFGLDIGLGLTQVDLKQTAPQHVRDVYNFGYSVLGAMRFGLIGDVNANIGLRVEANFRTYMNGRNADDSTQKVLPFEIISYPACVTATVRI